MQKVNAEMFSMKENNSNGLQPGTSTTADNDFVPYGTDEDIWVCKVVKRNGSSDRWIVNM